MTVAHLRHGNARWLMTSETWSALLAELEEVDANVAQDRWPEADVGLPSRDPVRRQRLLRAMRDAALVDDGPGRVAIGRHVTVREDDGEAATYAVVLPGHGDPTRGLISAESPLGAALLGASSGDVVMVAAPAGARAVRVLAVE